MVVQLPCYCRVIAWEPVPHFRAFLAYNRQLNHLEDLIEIRDRAVVEVGGLMYNLTVPQRGIWGTAGIGGLNIDRCQHLLHPVGFASCSASLVAADNNVPLAYPFCRQQCLYVCTLAWCNTWASICCCVSLTLWDLLLHQSLMSCFAPTTGCACHPSPRSECQHVRLPA